jgi:PKHD-type hydroxylase
MFKQLDNLLSDEELAAVRQIAQSAQFVDGRISNPYSKVKNNLHLNDQRAYQASAQILAKALYGSEDFRNFAFPKRIAPPLITRYEPGMHYGLHPDSATMQIGNELLRSDLSCTIFLNEPESYEGGALRILLGSATLRFKGPAGSAIVYPSTSLHEVEKIESGQRLVAITFIHSQIADVAKRNLLYELNEVAALEGHNMSYENFSRLQSVQFNLQRHWAET